MTLGAVRTLPGNLEALPRHAHYPHLPDLEGGVERQWAAGEEGAGCLRVSPIMVVGATVESETRSRH